MDHAKLAKMQASVRIGTFMEILGLREESWARGVMQEMELEDRSTDMKLASKSSWTCIVPQRNPSLFRADL